jgi:shikimate dehydrogenase
VKASLEAIRQQVTNPLPHESPHLFTGIVGDRPSQYAKTPHLWNAAYRELGWDAVSLAWDLPPDRLPAFVEAARESVGLLGFSVTVPFKTSIVPLLDQVDDLALQIGAVNTVVRSRDGRLTGYNTDGQGAIDALTSPLPGRSGGFVETLEGLDVLLIGAGGAAKAVAFFVARELGEAGRLRIVSRRGEAARELAEAVRAVFGLGDHGVESDLLTLAPNAELVINASTKGQAGWRSDSSGGQFQLEPYSALGPANPWRLPSGSPLDSAASREWFVNSAEDIARNSELGGRVAAALRPDAACFDLVYSPLETRFLADARFSGHRTMNGKWMNIAQAADAFATKVCTEALREGEGAPNAGYARVFEVMSRVW